MQKLFLIGWVGLLALAGIGCGSEAIEHSFCGDAECTGSETKESCAQDCLCPNPCPGLGYAECKDGQIHFCEETSDSCLKWGSFAVCPTSTCESDVKCGGCDATECGHLGDSSCAEGKLRVCEADNKGCLQLGTEQVCESGACQNGSDCKVIDPTKVEDTKILCSDKLDNDGDGLTDCADNDCKPTACCSVRMQSDNFVILSADYRSFDLTKVPAPESIRVSSKANQNAEYVQIPESNEIGSGCDICQDGWIYNEGSNEVCFCENVAIVLGMEVEITYNLFVEGCD